MWVLHITGVIKTPRRVEHNHKNWLHQYKQGGHMHGMDKWMTPQERKSFKNKNSNFKDEILITNYFKQNNFNWVSVEWDCSVAGE
jgi:hypothetical protein